MTLTVGILGSYSQNFDTWMEFILFDKPEGFWGLIGYWITYASLFVGIVIVSILAGFLLPSIIASPFYDYVSMKVETDLTGRKGEEVSLLRSLLLIKEEVKKVVFILAVSLIALFIPILNVVVFPFGFYRGSFSITHLQEEEWVLERDLQKFSKLLGSGRDECLVSDPFYPIFFNASRCYWGNHDCSEEFKQKIILTF